MAKTIEVFSHIFLIVLMTSVSATATADKITITEQINTCAKNLPGQPVFNFSTTEGSPSIEATDPSLYIIYTNDMNESAVILNRSIPEDHFSFTITNVSKDTVLAVNGTFRSCDPSSSNTSTVIIAFLASLCLILLTGLALSLIILRRKKPITFKFGQKEDNEEYEERQFNDNLEYDNSSSKSSSLDVTNNMLTAPKLLTPNSSPRPLQPRKSSLKPPRNSISIITDQINNNSSFDNTAFNATELEVVDEVNEDKHNVNELTIKFDETRRKSIVTFSDQPEVNYG